MATSLLTGKPAPSPLFSTGPSDGFSCHVNPSKLIAAHKERGKKEGGRVRTYGLNGELPNLKARQVGEIEKGKCSLFLALSLFSLSELSFTSRPVMLLLSAESTSNKVSANPQHKNLGK